MLPCGSRFPVPPGDKKYTGVFEYFALLGRDLIARQFGNISVANDAGFYTHI
ncbi:protein of unknown function [Xenorhabdus poinarii G6]|uniref:Uncharacterized protein n=1 Tax=Xenorhabdus poinarii G6 TaxID=1354304 RepID=A0A068R443_9GAMM|nr:protein of unknown function [Xenorhabdus poinarii G6]